MSCAEKNLPEKISLYIASYRTLFKWYKKSCVFENLVLEYIILKNSKNRNLNKFIA